LQETGNWAETFSFVWISCKMKRWFLLRRIRQLQSEDWFTRMLAARRLAKAHDSVAIEPLIAALEDKEDIEAVCCAVAEALGALRDARAVDPLIQALSDRRVAVRRSAIGALSTIGDRRALEPLGRILRETEDDWVTRIQAAQALDALDWKPPDASMGALQAVLLGKWEDSRSLGEAAVSALLEAMTRCQDGTISRKASEIILNLGPAAVEQLICELRGNDPLKRAPAANLLRRIGDKRAVEPLINVLMAHDQLQWGGASDPWIVVRALEDLRDERAVEPLLEIMGGSDWYLRREAAKALSSLGWKSTSNQETVLLVMAQGNWDSVVALGDSAVPFIIEALKVDYPPKAEFIVALERIGSPNAIRALLLILEGLEGPYLRADVLGALERIGDAQAVLPLLKVAASDKGFASLAIEAVRKVLERNAPAVSHADLKVASSFGDVLQRRVWRGGHNTRRML
jgi:HEAT repeat protein